MYAVIKGNLHRVENKQVDYMFCPFYHPHPHMTFDTHTLGKPCGTWCALFEPRPNLPQPEVCLHCTKTTYPLVQDIKSQPKEEGSKS